MKSNEMQPVFRDMLLRCKDCNSTFVLRKQEQEYLYQMHLAPYVRCAECRQRRKAAQQTANAGKGSEAHG